MSGGQGPPHLKESEVTPPQLMRPHGDHEEVPSEESGSHGGRGPRTVELPEARCILDLLCGGRGRVFSRGSTWQQTEKTLAEGVAGCGAEAAKAAATR
ncbi:hypothetical protein NDU88_005962 [Pleurodeles waltl]|uniref:Uncharacterized protein n=1 Tax=Pleurodeles waltl TaxID=8319 RepID=A0AAV7TC56_PLEWA|nr:hypothetical protein NDU88_005962 [Pleurodeles waltl]